MIHSDHHSTDCCPHSSSRRKLDQEQLVKELRQSVANLFIAEMSKTPRRSRSPVPRRLPDNQATKSSADTKVMWSFQSSPHRNIFLMACFRVVSERANATLGRSLPTVAKAACSAHAVARMAQTVLIPCGSVLTMC